MIAEIATFTGWITAGQTPAFNLLRRRILGVIAQCWGHVASIKVTFGVKESGLLSGCKGIYTPKLPKIDLTPDAQCC